MEWAVQQMEDSTLGWVVVVVGGCFLKVLLSSRVPCQGAAIVAARCYFRAFVTASVAQ